MGLNLKYISGDVFLNNSLSSLSEGCSFMIGGVFMALVGVRPTMLCSFSVAALFAIGIVLSSNSVVIAVCIFGSKLGIASANNMVFLANNELFSSQFLAVSYAFCNGVAKGARIGAPQIAEMGGNVPMLFYIGFAVLGFAAAYFVRHE